MGTGAIALHRARFAKRSELRELLHKTPVPDGVLLGQRRDYLFFKRFVSIRPTMKRREIGNTLIVAPTRGGKGLLAISQLLTWQHSVIVNDIKGELFQATAGYRATLGKVFVIDPTRGVGHCYDPLAGKETEDKLYNAAYSMLYEAQEQDPFWTQKAARMLQQLFLAGKREGIPGLVYLRHMSRRGLDEVAGRLNTLDPTLAQQFLDASFAHADFSSKTLQSAWSTLTARMHPFLTETVVRSFTHADFTADHMMRGERPVTVYLLWKEQDVRALSPLIRLLWGTLIDELITTYDSTQGNGCKPVLLLIDEAGRTAIPLLADQAATVVGRGISLWIAIQSLSQLEAVYGRSYAQILKDNMEHRLYYPPNDLLTAQSIEEELGDISAYAHSQTLKEGAEASEGLTERPIPLLTAQEIRQQKDEEVICFHRRMYPIRMHRMDWRQYPLLQQRCNLVAPQLAPLPVIADLPEEPEGSESSGSPEDEFINPDADFTN